jgi:hypothetical protein
MEAWRYHLQHLQCVSPIQLYVTQYQPKKGNVIDKQINQRQYDR